MSKKIYDENIDEVIDSDIDAISIEEIDKEIQDFYIDVEKIDSIKIPENKKDIIRAAMNRGKADMKAKKRNKFILGMASSISVILCIGVYSPALAHSVPPIEKVLQNINNTLKIDELASYTGIDKVFPRAVVDENGKIKFEKPTEYKVNKSDGEIDKFGNIGEEQEDKEKNEVNTEDTKEKEPEKNTQKKYENVEAPLSEYSAVQLIHQMSNSIIRAVDNRKYGEIPITPFNINQGIEGLKYIQDEGAVSYLNNALLKWKEGDFNNAVLVHNFVWEMLDGEVGKAISINSEKVDTIKNKYFK